LQKQQEQLNSSKTEQQEQQQQDNNKEVVSRTTNRTRDQPGWLRRPAQDQQTGPQQSNQQNPDNRRTGRKISPNKRPVGGQPNGRRKSAERSTAASQGLNKEQAASCEAASQTARAWKTLDQILVEPGGQPSQLVTT
jgi:hypothetical protein